MRPIKLELQAFGPYAGRQEIDFTELGSRRFFLIHGPTGSGKTSILDGICFALYSQMSGDGRRGEQMRSQQAPADLPMEVRFTFAVGAQRYQVTRSPAQTLLVRGKERDIAPKAELCRLTDGGEEPLASGERRVSDAIKAILGFQAEQFRQVVLIPQGEFRKLLSAGSDEREKILQVLLQVDGLRQIEDALKRRARALEEQLATARQVRATLLEEAAVQNLSQLKLRLEENRQRGAALDAQVEGSRAALARCRAAAETGRRDMALLTEHRDATAAAVALAQRAGDMDALAHRLERANAAAALVDIERSARARNDELIAAREEASRRDDALNRARGDSDEAQAALDRERQQAPRREQAAAEVFRLRALLPLAEQLAALQRAERAAEEALRAAGGHRARAEDALRANDDAQRRLLETIEQLEAPAAVLAEAPPALQAAQQVARGVHEMQALLQEQRRLREVAAQAEEARAAARQAHEAAEGLLSLQRARWESAQAAVLAAALAEGQPCPVCGAVHHPSPATAQEAPLREEMEALRAAAQGCRAALDIATERHSAAQLSAAAGEARVQAAREVLGEYAALPAEQADARVKECELALEQARQAQAQLSAARGQSRELAERRALLDQDAVLTRSAEQAAQQALAQAAADHRAAAAQVPEALRAAGAARAALDQALQLQSGLQAALERAEQRAAQVSAAVAAAEEACRAAQTALGQATQRASAERGEFLNRLGDSGFEGQADYIEARKQLSERELWRHTLEEYARARSAAADRLQRAETAAAGVAAPDMAALTQAESQASADYEAALAEQTRCTRQIEQELRWIERLDALERELAALDARYAVMGELSDIANGKNSLRLTLQRFVLGALFDDVTQAATQRLRAMSRGRYALQRASAPLDRRVAAGLDMEVFDEYTGKSRPVATLSGGESFLASLALALGLADVVQSYAGGIHLETIFIDEGFGTLDPEALDEALKVLLELQGAGRLVGIISHVPELRERIDARLEVTPADRGSSAAFVLG